MSKIFSTPASHLRQFRQSIAKATNHQADGYFSSWPKFHVFKHGQASTTTTTSEPIAGGNADQPFLLWRYQILDPGGDIVRRWNQVFLITSLISLFIDPLYFFLPFVGGEACMSTDHKSSVPITIFRSIFDIFYFLHIIMKFRTAFIAPSSKVFGRGELVMDPREITMNYLKSDFIMDFIAFLPLPQFVIWYVIPNTKGKSGRSNETLALIVLIQYVPRLFVIFPLNQRIIKTTGFIAKTAWAGAVYNLLLYMLASHVLGASWYLASIGRQSGCWQQECSKEFNTIPPCVPKFLDCDNQDLVERQYWLNTTNLLNRCDPDNEMSEFKFGIFKDAFTSEVASSKFIEKYLYCLWWGLRNLSSYGQSLHTSTYLGETMFSVVLSVVGLVLFARLIGNMQTNLQSMTVRLEEWRVKRRDAEEWMRHRQLPPELQKRVRRFNQYKWLTTRGVNEESILKSLPLDLRREIQRHLCLNLVRRVPFFAQMDDQLLDAICERLVSSLSTEGTYVLQEGDLVNEMLFIIRGQLESSTTNGGKSGFFNSITLGPGDFCGEELLTWALVPNSNLSLPSSTRTVRTLTEVEAFALSAEDLKFVAVQFKKLHSKKLQHAFRYYSHQWRAWGACYIQNAWRKYRNRKLERELSLREGLHGSSNNDFEYELLHEDDSPTTSAKRPLLQHSASSIQHRGATTTLVSPLEKDRKRHLSQRVRVADPAPSTRAMKKILKPDEPNFFVE